MDSYIYPAESIRKQYVLCANQEHRSACALAELELDLIVDVMDEIDREAGNGETSVLVFPQISLARNYKNKQIKLTDMHKICRKVRDAFRKAGYGIKVLSGIWAISWAD